MTRKKRAEMFEEILEIIKSRRDIVLATHILPDGDAIGSALGLGLLLRDAGYNVKSLWLGNQGLPDQYSYLPGQELLTTFADIPERFSLLVTLDCGSKERLGPGEKLLKRCETSINIDHHRNNTMFAAFNVVDPAFPSTSHIVFELAKKLGLPITKDVAVNLYTGLVTDTGRFQYSNTTSDAFRAAASLVDYGVDPALIFRKVYENTSLPRIKLAGIALAKTDFDPASGFIYTYISKDDFKQTEASIEDTENLIDFLRAVAGVSVAAVFKETDGGLRVSLRSTGSVDVGRIAGLKGGGGHRLAAGYNGSGSIEEAVADLKDLLASFSA
jgi:phosphoesterase RecJ-like protein